MSRGIYVALSGAVAQETALETTAENLANASTTGYQRARPVFKEVLSGATRKAGSGLHSTVVDQTALDTTRGSLKSTGRGLDIAMPEGVYLGVSTANGERFTRNGALKVTSDGSLTTSSGQKVLGEAGEPLTLTPGTEASIAADGSVTQGGAVVGRLRLMKLEAGSAMKHEAGNLLAATGPTPPVAAAATLDVGALEESNASVVGSMFEAFQRMLDTFGEIDRKVLTTVPSGSES